ncbi:hypothetical protein CB0940_03740 [Cercospora beticola]|uniref:RING-type domain-containing protein n=1 Tax=Cercospora beticola TaxID=122368 RepID=A0A2G5I4V4_CERBT|nr:hypothetical protein CB0940_03740 [Cercospora beticola]PIA99532.1 hypothetical protein CB0940_03740 [Cercospora beticola]WPB00932.1 hypothetical protein RHO25_005552 [Cercospora beticola]CAK1360812.1 unnamed protein product [Cercospora beticola]
MSLPTRAEYLRGLVPLALPFQPPNVDDGEDAECPICRVPYEDEPSTQIVETGCEHKFCYDCLLSWNQEHSSCPTCRKELYEPGSGAEDFVDFPIEAMGTIEVIEEAMALLEFGEDRVGHHHLDLERSLEAHSIQSNVPQASEHGAERTAAEGDAYPPVILEADYLWDRLIDEIRMLHEFNEWCVLAEIPIDPEPLPELPAFVQEMLDYNARCSFSCHDAGLTYQFDRLSVRGQLAGEDAQNSPAHPLNILAQKARSDFNSPECEGIITTIAFSVRRRAEGMNEEFDFRFPGLGPASPTV